MFSCISVLIIIVAVFGFRDVMMLGGNQGEPYLRINTVPKCWTGTGWSDNPPYFVSEKYYWWIHLTVSANANISDVVAFDELEEVFMIDGVSFVPIEKPGPYNFTFEYSVYESGARVNVVDGASVWTGYLDEAGVTFGNFVVHWTDESSKAHITWNIGSMDKGDVKEIYLTISTDKNPDGLQEFTSPGTYFLDPGATVEGIVESTGKQTRAETNYIEITVLEKIE